MKKKLRLYTRQLCLLISFSFISASLHAQGMPGSPTTTVDHDPTAGGASVHNNRRINMDMFGYYVAGATQLRPDHNLMVYAFDEIPNPGSGGSPSVRVIVWPEGHAAPMTHTIANATQPDILFPGGSPA